MTGIVILAAGSSVRLGQAKQMLPYKGKSLLQHAVNAACQSLCKPVIVVLGSRVEEVKKEIVEDEVHVVKNPDWEQGMSTSMQCGLVKALSLNANLSNIIIMLCDQPFVDATLLLRLVQQKKTSPKNIVACAYNQTVGPPALFNNQYFSALLQLKGHEGAKKLIMQNPNDVELVEFEPGKFDIDTLGDYEELLKNNG